MADVLYYVVRKNFSYHCMKPVLWVIAIIVAVLVGAGGMYWYIQTFPKQLPTVAQQVPASPEIQQALQSLDASSQTLPVQLLTYETCDIARLGFYKNLCRNVSVKMLGIEDAVPLFADGGIEVFPQEHSFASHVFARRGTDLVIRSVRERKDIALQATIRVPDAAFVRVIPSISQKNMYLVFVRNLEPEEGMFGYRIASVTGYVVNTDTGAVSPLPAPEKLANVFVYDSQQKVGYGWVAGEGIGSAGPVLQYQLDGSMEVIAKNLLDTTVATPELIEMMDVMETTYGFVTKEAAANGLSLRFGVYTPERMANPRVIDMPVIAGMDSSSPFYVNAAGNIIALQNGTDLVVYLASGANWNPIRTLADTTLLTSLEQNDMSYLTVSRMTGASYQMEVLEVSQSGQVQTYVIPENASLAR